MSSLMVFSGEYDLSCKEQFRHDLDSLVPDDHVIFDFTNVTYLDSTCLTELIRMNRLRKDKGFEAGTIVLSNHNVIRKLFRIARLDALFELVESIDSALLRNGETALIRYTSCGATA